MNQKESMVPLEPNDIARRYGTKPGYQLIDFLQVALPVFVIPIEAIVIASKPLGLVDEFLLRSITENINTLSTISGFLGLDEVFVKKRLGELITDDLIELQLRKSLQRDKRPLRKRCWSNPSAKVLF